MLKVMTEMTSIGFNIALFFSAAIPSSRHDYIVERSEVHFFHVVRLRENDF